MNKLIEEAYFLETQFPNYPQFKKKEILKASEGCTGEEADEAFKYVWEKLIVEM